MWDGYSYGLLMVISVFQEWVQILAFVLLLWMIIGIGEHYSFHMIQLSPAAGVGSLDGFNSSSLTVGYVASPPSGDIMKKVVGRSVIPGT